MSVDPYVIRSYRNRERRPAPPETGEKSEKAAAEGNPQNREQLDHEAQSQLRMVRKVHHLGYLSTFTIIFNRMVGTGIFVAPPDVLAIVQSKGLCLMIWLAGGIITWTGLMVYLEYGFLFPLTGGELHYIDCVWLRPRMLMTYVYAGMFILLSGSQANALIFGAGVIQASTSGDSKIDYRLQKFLAIVLVAIVCQVQSISRLNYIRFSNLFAMYKITLLTVLTILGWVALSSYRSPAARSSHTEYGTANFRNAFRDVQSQPYAIALALLDVMRVYSGYENANFILEEVRRPPGDETRVFRRSAILAVSVICLFYLMVNVSLFAACSTEELVGATDVLGMFFTKVFGASPRTRTASGVILALSSAGNVMSTTFAAVRVKQEIARLGVLPWPAFWAKSTRMHTPGPALLLHFFFSTILIWATPLGSDNGYLILSTLYPFARTIVAIILGLALLFATRLDAFRDRIRDVPWGTCKSAWSRTLVYVQCMIYVGSNLFVFVVSWFPAGLQDALHPRSRIVPSFVGPVVALGCFGLGFVWWLWDLHIAPALGWSMEPLQERRDGLKVHMTFQRRITGVSERVIKSLGLQRFFQDNSDSDEETDEDS